MIYQDSFQCEYCNHRFLIIGEQGILTFLALRVWHEQVKNHRLGHLVETAIALKLVENLP